MKLITFVRGLTIGFILGLLFAPDKGSATRRKLASAASDIKEDMDDTCNEISGAISRTAKTIKRKVKGTVSDLEQNTAGTDEGIIPENT